MQTSLIKVFLSVCIGASSIIVGQSLIVSSAQAETKGASGLPLPRFVSLKAKKVNMRVGPGQDYKVEWRYIKSGLPLEILQEYDNWRKVRDSEGDEGWISKSLLSGKRTAIVAPWKAAEKKGHVSLKKSPNAKAMVLARMEPGLLIKVKQCQSGWCEIDAGHMEGYAIQSQLWGVYPDEQVK